jgi:hypothetical protein
MLTDQPRELLRQILALENERSTASFRRAFFPCCMGISPGALNTRLMEVCVIALTRLSKPRLAMCGTSRQRALMSTAFIPLAVSLPTLVLITVLIAQEAMASYCGDLKRAVDLAMTNERFASISTRPREGNFTDSSLVLMDWNDCSVYGGRIYTCDSQPIGTAQDAQQAQQKIFREVQACLATSWAEAKDRSSLGFIVLHHADQPVSITLSIDQNDQKQYVTRLILFGRSN